MDTIHASLVDLFSLIYGQLSQDIEFREAYYTDLTSATAPTYTRTSGLPIDGSATNDALPANCALCISHRTNGRGRSSRGRTYIAGIPEDIVNVKR